MVADAKPCVAEPPEYDDWSRERMYVYDAWKVSPFTVMPLKPSVTCLLSDCRFDPISITWPSDDTDREFAKSSAPVPGTIDARRNVDRPIALVREREARLRHEIHILEAVQAHAARVARVETQPEAIENAPLHAERCAPRARRSEVLIERRDVRAAQWWARRVPQRRTTSGSSTDPTRTRCSPGSAPRSRCTRAATPSPQCPSRPRPPKKCDGRCHAAEIAGAAANDRSRRAEPALTERPREAHARAQMHLGREFARCAARTR